MNPNYHDRPDGEYFTDAAPKQAIPAADTWESLSVNQLIEAQLALQNNIWAFRSNELISKQLNTQLARLEALLKRRMSENR